MNQSFKIISHDMTAERWHCLFCMLWRLVFVVRIHCFHFPHNGLRLPFVSLLCRNISFELSSKPKRNQETSSQKHMLSRGCCGIPLHSGEIYNYKNEDWNMEQVTSGSYRFFKLNIRVKKEGKTNRNLLKNE